ncbi:MAG TPA: TonB family protein, partial [Pyrinomonadaceae bacterium]|nr:TonB family protein [Pyrinomonadaceae bacterium]
SVIGCDHFILMRTQTQRRESLDRGTYYEAYAAAFVVNARSGRLDGWLLNSVDERSPEKAEQLLRDQTRSISSDIVKIVKDPKNANQQKSSGKFEMVPSDDSPLAQGLKPPIPYRRIKPEYTSMAFLYGIRGTVEIEVDIAADGNVERTSIEHWAGYGLDESVEKAVRSMNWRPAMRNGKALAMRVLLRYNFTKIEKDNDEP